MMEAVMDGIGKHAAFYRAYLPHDRGVVPMGVAVGTVVALGLFLYLVSAVGPAPKRQGDQDGARAAAVLVSRPVRH
jgi:hypothetical protein